MQKYSSPYIVSDTDFVMTTGNIERQYVTKFRDLPDTDKPREKLVEHGVKSLTLPELLAVILGVGTKKENVMEMSQRILREYGNSALADQMDVQKLAADLGISLGKASQLVACMEIGRRLYRRNDSGLAVIRTAKDLYDYVKDMHGLPKEQLRGVYLDTHNRVIHDEVISIGTINSNIVHPREVFKPALEYGAAAVVLVHNHPSGVSTPSISDIEITKQLIAAGKIVGINLLDHIVVSRDGFTSIDVQY
ncbi:MAG: DNA repair protein RadC [Patescibacteria group bacterium]